MGVPVTEKSQIAAALAKAQAEMGKALKQSVNPAFRSKYADLGSVMDACLPALNANGIAVIQPSGEDDTGRHVETILIHESGERLSCRVPLIVAKNDMQGYGSAVTYARRYGLMSMAGIAPEDDDGNAAAKAPPPQQEQRQQPRLAAPDPAQIAVESLRKADTLDALASIWRDLPAGIKTAQSVILAKDARKAELTPTDIPY
jgi:hypothetical protein